MKKAEQYMYSHTHETCRLISIWFTMQGTCLTCQSKQRVTKCEMVSRWLDHPRVASWVVNIHGSGIDLLLNFQQCAKMLNYSFNVEVRVSKLKAARDLLCHINTGQLHHNEQRLGCCMYAQQGPLRPILITHIKACSLVVIVGCFWALGDDWGGAYHLPCRPPPAWWSWRCWNNFPATPSSKNHTESPAWVLEGRNNRERDIKTAQSQPDPW